MARRWVVVGLAGVREGERDGVTHPSESRTGVSQPANQRRALAGRKRQSLTRAVRILWSFSNSLKGGGGSGDKARETRIQVPGIERWWGGGGRSLNRPPVASFIKTVQTLQEGSCKTARTWGACQCQRHDQ